MFFPVYKAESQTRLSIYLEAKSQAKGGLIWQNLDVLHTTRAYAFCTRCNCFMHLSSTLKRRELQ